MQFIGLELDSGAEKDGFGEKFLNTFGKFRQLNYLMIYGSQLKKLVGGVRQTVIEDLKRFIVDILNGKFEVNRNSGLPQAWAAGSCEKVAVGHVNFKVILEELIEKGDFADLGERVKVFLNNPGASLPEDVDPVVRYSVLLSREGGQHLVALQEALQRITPEPKKLLDKVQGLIQMRKFNSEECTLVDSSDPQDFLEMGVVVQSCQSVSDDPTFSKGLLGTALNGHNRLLLLRDPEGHTIGRAQLRLMKHGKEYALFVERVYPLAWNNKSIIIDFAMRRARELGLPLFANDQYIVDFTTSPAQQLGLRRVVLTSQPGPGSYEYVDALKGIVPKGDFRASTVCIYPQPEDASQNIT